MLQIKRSSLKYPIYVQGTKHLPCIDVPIYSALPLSRQHHRGSCHIGANRSRVHPVTCKGVRPFPLSAVFLIFMGIFPKYAIFKIQFCVCCEVEARRRKILNKKPMPMKQSYGRMSTERAPQNSPSSYK